MNRLQYLLSKLAEECNEVAQVTLKTAQFGLDGKKPGQDQTNHERIHSELNDLVVIIMLLNKEFGFNYVIPDKDITEPRTQKVEHYYNYAVQLGTVRND